MVNKSDKGEGEGAVSPSGAASLVSETKIREQEALCSPAVASEQEQPRPGVVLAHTQFQAVSYQGPLPPAAEMERYHALNPAYADRIIAMAEKEQVNRHVPGPI